MPQRAFQWRRAFVEPAMGRSPGPAAPLCAWNGLDLLTTSRQLAHPCALKPAGMQASADAIEDVVAIRSKVPGASPI